MATGNFDFEQYYGKYLDAEKQAQAATNQVNQSVAGEGKALTELQDRMRQFTGDFEPERKNAREALTKVAAGSRQYLDQIPKTINPADRSQLARDRWAIDVGNLGYAKDTLAGMRGGAQDVVDTIMRGRQSEVQNLAAAAEAKQAEANTLMAELQLRQQEDQRQFENAIARQQLARMGGGSSGSGDSGETDIDKQWAVLRDEALSRIPDTDENGNPLPQEQYDYMVQDFIYNQLMQGRYGGNEELWKRWRGLPGVVYDDTQSLPFGTNLLQVGTPNSVYGTDLGYNLRAGLGRNNIYNNEPMVTSGIDYTGQGQRDIFGIK